MLDESPTHREDSETVRCAGCGAVVGVYEPIVVRAPDGDLQTTSLAALHEIHAEDRHFHPSCYPWVTASRRSPGSSPRLA